MKNPTGPHLIIGDNDQHTKEITDPMEVIQVISQSLDRKISSLTAEFRTKFGALLEVVEATNPNLYKTYQENLAKKTAFGLYRALDRIRDTGDLEATTQHKKIIEAIRLNAKDEGLEDAFYRGMVEYRTFANKMETKDANGNNNKTS